MNLKIIARRLFFFFFCEGMPAKPGAVDYVKKTPEAGTDSIYYDDDGKPETHFVSVVFFFAGWLAYVSMTSRDYLTGRQAYDC